MIDLEPGVLFQAFLHLDSSTVFRMRRCCQHLRKLLNADSGFNYWHCLLQSASGSLGSHTNEGGMWLHALVHEETLSQYAKFCSTVELATDLKFNDMATLKDLIELCRCPMSRSSSGSIIGDVEDVFGLHQEAILDSQENSCLGKGQRFLGTWEFNHEDVRAMLRKDEPGLVCSSVVEFIWLQSFYGSFLKFGVRLVLSRAVGDRFLLSWQPLVMTPGLLQEHLDCFEIHLHGWAAKPSLPPLSYHGSISMTFSLQAELPSLHTLSVADVMELLEHEHLICALNIHVYCLGNVALVNSAKGFDAKAQIDYQWTESGRKNRRRTKIGHLWTEILVDKI